MRQNNLYTVNPLYGGSLLVPGTEGDSNTSGSGGGGTTIIYQGGGMTPELKSKLDGIQVGAEVNLNAFSHIKIAAETPKIISAAVKTDTLSISGTTPIVVTVGADNVLTINIDEAALKALIDKTAYWKKDKDGNLYTEDNVYSTKEISAYGMGPGGGSSGGAGALYECADVLRDGDKVLGASRGSLLSYNGTHWYGIPQSSITPDLSGYATTSAMNTAISKAVNGLIDSAPGTLDTLNEIAAALGDDPNFAATITGLLNAVSLRVTDLEDKTLVFNDMFEWDKSASTTDKTKWIIKAKNSLYSVGEVSAYGYASSETPIGASYMYELKDVLFTDLTGGLLLKYNGTKWVNVDANEVGLNEALLAAYLTTNNYAKKTDIPSLADYATKVWVEGKGYLIATTTDKANWNTAYSWGNHSSAGYVSNTTLILAGVGLSGGGNLTASRTLALATVGTAGIYPKVTVDIYGRVTNGTILLAGDIPLLTISKITGLLTVLDSKIDIAEIGKWFTIIYNADKTIKSILANYNFYSLGEVSAYGVGDGELPSGALYLTELKDVNITTPTNRQALVYDSASSKWINGSAGLTDFTVNVGSTAYNSVNGVVSLPAYPTAVDLSNYVTLNTSQIITGAKTITYSEGIRYTGNNGHVISIGHNSNSNQIDVVNRTGNISYAVIVAGSFKKEAGTASQLLRADGGVATFNWAGHDSTPTWVWGAENQYDYNLYAPRYFRVANADTVGDIAASNLVTKQNWTSVVDGRYLPLSGGTMTGILQIDEIDAPNGYGLVQYNGGNCLLAPAEGTTYIRSGFTHLMHRKNGADHIIWDTSNHGSGSGLDADLLDGNHYREILERKGTTAFNQVLSDAWYRIGEFIGNNSESPQAIIMINRNYSSPQNEGYTFSITVGYNGAFNISQLSGNTGGHVVDKIRIDYTNSGKAYLDLYVRYAGYTNMMLITSIGAFSVYTTPITNPGTVGTFSAEYATLQGMYNNHTFTAGIGFKSRNICIETDNNGNDNGNASEINNWNSNLYINNKSGTRTIIGLGGGPVCIGTAEGNEKLNVNGWINTIGNVGWHNSVYGGGIYMEDTSYIKTYNGKAFMSTATNAHYAFFSQGGYYSTWNTSRGDTWANALEPSYSVFNLELLNVDSGTYQNILGWGGGMNGIGYTTRYSIGSRRDAGRGWGGLALSVGNNDAGNSGYQLVLWGTGSMEWTGNIVASGEITAYSDQRLKSNILNLTHRGRLQPKTFYKDNKQLLGFIALEVLMLYPELISVGTDELHYLSMNYGAATAVLSALLNMVEDEVTILKLKVLTLEEKINLYESINK